MNKQQIIDELDVISAIAEVNDNVLICDKVKRIKEALATEWNESDLYEQQVKKVLRYDETMNNLNNLTIKNK